MLDGYRVNPGCGPSLCGPKLAEMWDVGKLKQAHETNKFQFIVIELELAITFAEMAKSSRVDETSKRNAENARRAYEAAEKFLKDAGFTPDKNAVVTEKLERLHTLLDSEPE